MAKKNSTSKPVAEVAQEAPTELTQPVVAEQTEQEENIPEEVIEAEVAEATEESETVEQEEETVAVEEVDTTETVVSSVSSGDKFLDSFHQNRYRF